MIHDSKNKHFDSQSDSQFNNYTHDLEVATEKLFPCTKAHPQYWNYKKSK